MKGFKGTRKGTPFAAQIAAEDVAKKAAAVGMKSASVFVKGPGPGREPAIRSIQSSGLHDQPSTFLNNKATTEPTSRNTEQRNYYMTNLQHFLTTKLLHDQTSTFLNNKTTT